MNKPLRIAAASVMCMAVGGALFADNRSGMGSDMDPNKPGTPGNAANTGSNADMTAKEGMSGMGQADVQMAAALKQIAQDPTTAADKLFLLDAATMDLWEIQFATLVQEKAQDEQVKQLAQHIIKDHTESSQQLMKMAKQMGLTLPTSLPAQKQLKLAVFSAMPAQQLETCFVVDNKADHARAITSYRDHSKTLKDESLRQFVTSSIPKLEAHGQHIMQVAQAKNVGDPTAMMPRTGSQTGNTNTAGVGDR